jgi:hypothetical protein
LVGTCLGGSLAARYAPKNERLQLKAMAACYLGQTVLFSIIYLSHSPYWALGMLGILWIVGNAVNPPMFALIQSLVPERMRTMSIALLFLCANLIGMGLGAFGRGRAERRIATLGGRRVLALRTPCYVSRLLLGGVAFVSSQADRHRRPGGESS